MKNLYTYFFVIVFFFLGSIEAKAVFTVDGVHYWKCGDGNVKVGPYSMRDEFNVTPEYYGDIVIPAEVTYEGITYQVIGLMDCAFKNSNSVYNGKPALRSVTIEAPITEIPYKCFQFSDVEEVYLPPTITSFGKWSFYRCSKLKTVEIPPSAPLVSLGEMCFCDCQNLKSLSLPNSVYEMGNRCFENTGLTYFDVPSSMTYLPDRCFDNSKIEEVIIPEGVNRLGQYCFRSTRLKTLELPWPCRDIYTQLEDCFYLEKLVLHGNLYIIESLVGCYSLKELYLYQIEPPLAYDYTFEDLPDEKVLYVPEEAVETYRTTEPWNTFIIMGISTEGIRQTVSSSEEDATFYNVHGQKVSTPGKGIFIRKGKKILLK